MDGVVVEQKEAEHVRGDCVNALTTWFCEHLFHFDSCICTLLFDKYKKGYNPRLIEYSRLVLGTRSAAKFEQVPRSSGDPLSSKSANSGGPGIQIPPTFNSHADIISGLLFTQRHCKNCESRPTSLSDSQSVS